MAKKIDTSKIVVGSKVAFNTLNDAIWFDVVARHGPHNLEIRESGTNYATQIMDKCYVVQLK